MTRSEHVLATVAEEGVEVSQRATKALRFGLEETQPGQDRTNFQRLHDEYVDLVAMLELVDPRITIVTRDDGCH